VALGRWRWPAIAWLSFLALVCVGMPLFVLGWQVIEGVSNGEPLQTLTSAIRNSMLASLLGALLTVAAAMPIAWMAVRRPGTVSRVFERASYSGYALPGIVVALALVFFGARYVPALYQTLPWLLFAYMVRFLPEALGASRSSLLQINPATEEAGRSLGHGGFVVFVRVTLPQMVPGLSAAGALVFLTIMKELPATLLLSPIGFDTLAVDVWSLSREAYFARAAFAATTLVVLAGIPVALLALREKPIS
jgi:iron(III) transport system permease protein